MHNTVQPGVFVFVFVFSLARYCTAQCAQVTRHQNYKALDGRVSPSSHIIAFRKKYIHSDAS